MKAQSIIQGVQESMHGIKSTRKIDMVIWVAGIVV
jgi:hypothetical protein